MNEETAALVIVYSALAGREEGGFVFPDEETAKRVMARAKVLMDGLRDGSEVVDE